MALVRSAMRPLTGWLPSPLLFLAVLVTLVVSAPLVAFGLVSFSRYVGGQFGGAAYHADFLNYYSAARMLLEQPADLYLPSAEAAFQRQLAGGADVYDQFWSLPQLGLLFVPLALLPYATAYLAWSVINLALLSLSAFLIAPPVGGHNAWWLWTLLGLTFLPVQQALVDGQTPFVVLFGFCGFVWLTRRGRRSAPIALLTWAWKPQLMLGPLLALLAARGGRARAQTLASTCSWRCCRSRRSSSPPAPARTN